MLNEKPRLQLRAGLVKQKAVIHALLMREIITRFGRHNIGFLWLFVEPMIFTIGITALWNATKATHGSNLPITAFAVTGYSTVLLWRNMPSRTIGAIEPNLALLYHRHVRPIDIYAARLALEGIGATMSFFSLSLIFIFTEWMKAPSDIIVVASGWLLTAWFGMSLALLLGALSSKFEIVDKLWHPAAYLLFPLSGAAFSVGALPEGARDILLYLPMVNCTEMIREGYFGSIYKAYYDLPYVIVFCSILSLFALLAERWSSRGIQPE